MRSPGPLDYSPLVRMVTACPEEDLLLRFSAQKLEPAELGPLEGHLDGCELCRRTVSVLVGGLGGPLPSPDGGEASTFARAFGLVPLASGARLGRYEVQSLLGVGGMGAVYAAADPELERPVALKLLATAALDANQRARWHTRLQREAKALAKLSHPNVVTIHDVGAADGQTFFAMELVDGVTLAEWVRQAPRSPPEVLEVFLQAGSGLAAAHAAGLVHRDFKPSNVLVGRDGRVRITDFGLVAALDEVTPDPRPGLQPAGPDATLTRDGNVVGTPAFMSPEQRAGQRGDARSDQYSFCSALAQTLLGRPVAGPADALGLRALTQRQRRALARGLSPDPASRHPDLGTLLALLRPAQRRRVLPVTAAAAAALCAALLATWALRPSPCGHGDVKLRRVWTPGVRQTLGGRLSSSAVAALDAYAAGWRDLHRQACEATRVHGEQSEAVLDARVACLQDALERLDATARLLASAEPELALRAPEVIARLPSLAPCADVKALAAAPHQPDSAADRERAVVLRRELAEVDALRYAGKVPAALARALPLSEQATALAFGPLEAESLLSLAELYLLGDQDALAEAALRKAVVAAERGRADRLAIRAWTRLAHVFGERVGRFEEGRWAIQHARALLAHVSRDEVAEAKLEHAQGTIEAMEGHVAKADAHYRKGQALMGSRPDAELPDVLRLASDYAGILALQKRWPEAMEAADRGIALARALGDDHTLLARALTVKSFVLVEQGRTDEAMAAQRRALAIDERAFGADHGVVRSGQWNLACILLRQGRCKEALPYLEAVYAARDGQPLRPDMSLALGRCRIAVGRLDEGLAALKLGQEAIVRMRTDDPQYEALLHQGMASYALARGDGRAASAHVRSALQAHAKAPNSPWISEGELRLLNAQVLWAASRDLAGAREQADRALDAFGRQPPEVAKARQAEVTQWLSTLPVTSAR